MQDSKNVGLTCVKTQDPKLGEDKVGLLRPQNGDENQSNEFKF